MYKNDKTQKSSGWLWSQIIVTCVFRQAFWLTKYTAKAAFPEGNASSDSLNRDANPLCTGNSFYRLRIQQWLVCDGFPPPFLLPYGKAPEWCYYTKLPLFFNGYGRFEKVQQWWEAVSEMMIYNKRHPDLGCWAKGGSGCCLQWRRDEDIVNNNYSTPAVN